MIGCSKFQKLNLSIYNEKYSNLSEKYGDLPLQLCIYSTQNKTSLNTSDFSTFWSQETTPAQLHTLNNTTLKPNSHKKITIRYPKEDHYLYFTARFFNPQYKKWYSITTTPNHLEWRSQEIYAKINRSGIHLSIKTQPWLTQ